MPRNPLQRLLSIRLVAVDHAMQSLAAGIAAEQDASSRLEALEASAASERAAVDQMSDGVPDLEAFARWTAWARERRHEAAASLARAEIQTAAARVALANARAAARAVEELIALRKAELQSQDAAREAHALDDISAQRHRNREYERNRQTFRPLR